MSYTQFPLSEHHAALLAALPGRSPSISSQGDEPPLLSKGAEAASSSQQQNPNPSIFFETFSNVCQKQLQQHQHNQHTYGLINKLT